MMKNRIHRWFGGAFVAAMLVSTQVYALCIPGEKICANDSAVQECNADGQSFKAPVDCGETEGCFQGGCVELCELAKKSPSSEGCSFIGNRMDNLETIINNLGNDGFIVGNNSTTKTAQVSLFFVPIGSNTEMLVQGPVDVLPLQSTTFEMDNETIANVTAKRSGGVFRVQSNIPVTAYQHSPLLNVATNDGALLLPEHALRQTYVISSFGGTPFVQENDPNDPNDNTIRDTFSYFNIIGTQDNTTVTWTPKVNSAAGVGVPAVTAGNTGQITLNRYDLLQVRAEGLGDLSGTFVESDKPIWVMSASECASIPTDPNLTCNLLLEQAIPVDFWGKEYTGVALDPFASGNFQHLWRVYSGADNVTITTTPPQPGTPVILNKGEFVDISTPFLTTFTWQGDGPFMPVQYMKSTQVNMDFGVSGDPSMCQSIPVEQYLSSYVVSTGLNNDKGDDDPNNDLDYLNVFQIVRPQGGADILLDGVVVPNFSQVGLSDFEFRNFFNITEGTHSLVSQDPFGVLVYGFLDFFAYSYPGGLRLKTLNAPDCGDGVVQPGEECDDGNQLNTDECSTTCRSLIADIQTVKIPDKKVVKVGDTLTYLIQATNLGPANDVIVQIVDPLVPETEFISVNPGLPFCSELNNTVTCTTPPLDAGDIFEAEIKVKVVGVPQNDDNVIVNLAVSTPVGLDGTGGDTGTGTSGTTTAGTTQGGTQDGTTQDGTTQDGTGGTTQGDTQGDGTGGTGLVPTDPNPGTDGKSEVPVNDDGTATATATATASATADGGILEGSGNIGCSVNPASSASASWIQFAILGSLMGCFFISLKRKA